MAADTMARRGKVRRRSREKERKEKKEEEEEEKGEGGTSRPLTIAIDDSIENVELRYNIRGGIN